MKHRLGDESVVFVRNLSQMEIRALERYPELQQKPESVLPSLAAALDTMDDLASGAPSAHKSSEG